MKTMYVCEKCHKEYDNWDAAYECESGHVIPEGLFESEKHATWAKGQKLPATITMGYATEWNQDAETFIYKGMAVYKYVGEADKAVLAEYNAEKVRQAKEYHDTRRARQAEIEAEEAAKAEKGDE